MKEVNDLDLGFNADGTKLSMLLYADDIVSIAKFEGDLQHILDKVPDCCRCWGTHQYRDPNVYDQHVLSFNSKSTNVLELVDSYKYLGVTFRSNHDFTLNAELLAKSSGRALGKVKMRELNDLKLYSSCVVMDYCSGVWGFKRFQSLDSIHYRAIKHYL